MKKVLIITYYWPPSGGGGVQRWLKLSKYLPENGWKPIVYTPLNPDPSVIDESLLNEIHPKTKVIKRKIWEPYQLYRLFTRKKNAEKFKAGYISEASKGGLKDRISVFVRGNLLIPDPRKFWIKPSIRFLSKYLKNNPVDVIVTTGPPHSMHMIGLGLKKRCQLPWIADFRDPWTDIDFYDSLKLTKWANRLHHKFEKEVVLKADKIVAVSFNWAKKIEEDHKRKVDVITNGFDPEDFKTGEETLSFDFTITHIGSFNRDRNPGVFWKALKDLCKENEKFKEKLEIKLIGQVDKDVLTSIKNNGLYKKLKEIQFIPHDEIAKHLKSSQLLLLPINKTNNALGIIPGKVFEYIAAQRPILIIGPSEGDSAKIISELNAGVVCDFEEYSRVKAKISDYFEQFIKNELILEPCDFNRYSRKELAKSYSVLFDNVKIK